MDKSFNSYWCGHGLNKRFVLKVNKQSPFRLGTEKEGIWGDKNVLNFEKNARAKSAAVRQLPPGFWRWRQRWGWGWSAQLLRTWDSVSSGCPTRTYLGLQQHYPTALLSWRWLGLASRRLRSRRAVPDSWPAVVMGGHRNRGPKKVPQGHVGWYRLGLADGSISVWFRLKLFKIWSVSRCNCFQLLKNRVCRLHMRTHKALQLLTVHEAWKAQYIVYDRTTWLSETLHTNLHRLYPVVPQKWNKHFIQNIFVQLLHRIHQS